MIAMLLITSVVLTACGSKNTDSVATSDEETSATVSSVETYTISAGGLKLKYPQKWKDFVKVEADDEEAVFSKDGNPVMVLTFNSDDGDVLGTVKEDEYIVVRFKLFDAKDKDMEMMQEDLSVVIENLKRDYDFVSGAALEKNDDSAFEIKTDVVSLYYPTKWKDKVSIDVEPDRVSFKRGKSELFDFVFAESDKGDYLGSYKGTPVYVVTYKVTDSEAASMQEDLNVVLQHLREDSGFSDE